MNKNITGTILFLGLIGNVFLLNDATAQSRGAKQVVAGKIYCWDTPEGRMCGDTLPADHAGARRDEISSRTGGLINQIERAKTPEELALEKHQKDEIERQRIEAEKLARDKANVRMRYESIDAIKKEFEDRRKTLEVGLRLAQTSEMSAHQSFISALDDLAGLESEGKPITNNALKKISDRQVEWKGQISGIEAAKTRILELNKEMQEQIDLWMDEENNQELQ